MMTMNNVFHAQRILQFINLSPVFDHIPPLTNISPPSMIPERFLSYYLQGIRAAACLEAETGVAGWQTVVAMCLPAMMSQ